MLGQNPANHVFVDFGTERQGDLIRNPGTSPSWISSLNFQNGVDQLFGRALRARAVPAPRRKQQTIFPRGQNVVKMQQRRRLQNNGAADKTRPADEEHTQTGHYPVSGA
jgi:hypothetical protein